MYESLLKHFNKFARDQLVWISSHPQHSELEHWIAQTQDLLYIHMKQSSQTSWGLVGFWWVFLLFSEILMWLRQTNDRCYIVSSGKFSAWHWHSEKLSQPQQLSQLPLYRSGFTWWCSELGASGRTPFLPDLSQSRAIDTEPSYCTWRNTPALTPPAQLPLFWSHNAGKGEKKKITTRHRKVYTNTHFLLLNDITQYCVLQTPLTEI